MNDIRTLVRRCLAGEQSAMRELVERYQGQVYGLCYRMLGRRHDAEDVAQESFLRVLRNLHRWDPRREFEPWLLAIAGNRCRTALAARKRKPALQTLVEPVPSREADWQAAHNLAEEVQLALGSLRPEYREAFVLFHEHELSYAEIAESLAVPIGTIKTWVHRARKELITQLRQREVVQEPQHALRRI